MANGRQRSHHGWQARVGRGWTLCLLSAVACDPKGALATHGATGASGGVPGTGGARGAGGETATSVAPETGGTAGRGSVAAEGGSSGAGGAVGAGGSARGGIVGGPCETDRDCPSDTTCCDGSDERCDVVRLPPGDGERRGDFVVAADGSTVSDAITGLAWQRDGAGERAGCASDGTNLTCTWAEAATYCAALELGGKSDWRLPGAIELLTIVDQTRSGMRFPAAIDGTAFPSTAADRYWTASPRATYTGAAWVVDFFLGNLLDSQTAFSYRVRCVRGSRCHPTSRFAVLEGGWVRDTMTGLEWQQQVNPAAMRWEDANLSCTRLGSGARAPTLKELASLLDLTRVSPAIDPQIFPDTPADWFWTASPSRASSVWGWAVSFATGYSNSDAEVIDFHRVRCVRD